MAYKCPETLRNKGPPGTLCFSERNAAMKVKNKILIIAVTAVMLMLVAPLLAIKLSSDACGMGLFLLFFFIVNPLMMIALSILAGTDLRKLWWTPLVIAAVFPVLFAVAIWDFVWDLYFYSAIYLPIGMIAMLLTYWVRKIAAKGKG